MCASWYCHIYGSDTKEGYESYISDSYTVSDWPDYASTIEEAIQNAMDNGIFTFYFSYISKNATCPIQRYVVTPHYDWSL